VPVSEGAAGGTVWVAALEQLPPDSRGFRRTLRLHAVAMQEAGPAAPRAACGYEYGPQELRFGRAWGTVTETGRCALCALQLRRTQDSGVALRELLDLNEPDEQEARRRFSVVAEEVQPDGERARRNDPDGPRPEPDA
jgi:hypothetical protein